MMKTMTDAVKENREAAKIAAKKPVVNFMGGTSYEVNPLDTLKMVSASSIFGEPAYYRDGIKNEAKVKDGVYRSYDAFKSFDIFASLFSGKSTTKIMEEAIDNALIYDYEGTLNWAVQLRHEYLMRLNPQVIMVRAALMTGARKAFTAENPGKFNEINDKVLSRADDVIAQATYALYMLGNKKGIPSCLKRSWAKKVESLNAYQIYKYRNHGIGLIDTVRICHANNALIDELMSTGTVVTPPESKTWETLKASGDNWTSILKQIKMPHMALLRNLRGIFSEITDSEETKKILEGLVAGVANGKQFPFRYMSAYNNLGKIENIAEVQDTLEDCLDKSCENLPKLKGNNAFLSDNSGSAWGTCTSEYGTVTVANIGNLSAVIGAANSDKGTVFTFGDKLLKFPISKRNGILKQSQDISTKSRKEVGQNTENGIWLFFNEALENKTVYNNIFIYSDMQAGHGELYGVDASKYQEFRYKNGRYIDVARLIDVYRQKVNPKVNVFCIQTAGYNNVLVPENGYRTNILYGWTGKELVYADAMNKFWDEIDARKNK